MIKGIEDVLQTEMLNFTAPILVNNLPSIDGLLVSQRQALWGMKKAGMTSDKQFVKMLKASGRIFDYYILGDMPLCGVLKNMANNYILNQYLMPEGSFGNKNFKNSKGSAPRYIECKLDKYGEYMLEGINKNAVPMKWNYDATEKEPIVLPSIIPNILTNLRMSIAVSEANKMPSHNMEDTCDAISVYIKTKDIDKTIKTLKCPDLPSRGRIVFNEKDIYNIYKNGKGSFINIGKYRYDEKERVFTIYEIPYNTYVENIIEEIDRNMSKFQQFLTSSPHNASDKDGLKLELCLKKNVNIALLEKLLRKYTSYESKFACNFTILDLDGKTPKLMSLENIIQNWIKHRQTCIKNEYNYDIGQQSILLNRYSGLEIINKDLDKVINTIKQSSNEQDAVDKLIKFFDLNKEQAEYIKTIKLININKDWISDKINKIIEIRKNILKMKTEKEDIDFINNIIIQQLEDIKKKFCKPRKTEIIYEDTIEDMDTTDIEIEDYNCRLIYTKQGYIKKHLKKSDNHKIKDDDVILGDIETNNKHTLLIFTDKANRYSIPVYELNTYTPSQLGDYIYNVTNMDKDENIIKIVSIPKDSKGYMVFIYNNGKVAKIDINSYLSNNKKLQNCYNTDNDLIAIDYIEKDTDVLLISNEGKTLILNTERINSKSSRNSQGVTGIKLNEGYNCVGSVIGVNKEYSFRLITEKEKSKEFMLDDVVSQDNDKRLFDYLYSRPSNMGNFLLNTRKNNDKIIKFEIL